METKKMTLAEAQEFVNNTKFICTSVEETKRVQEKLFNIGIKWRGEQADEINEDAFLLFVENYNIVFDGDISYWMAEESRRIEPSEILAIEIKQEPKPKFDPNTLQPFDKVLVRCSDNTKWGVDFFSYKDEESHSTFRCIGYWYSQCIPYNEETKHLVGTADEAPDFYNIW